MRTYKEIYPLSLCHDTQKYWPTKLFKDLRKIYLFDQHVVFDKQQMIEEQLLLDKYIIFPSSADPDILNGIYNPETRIALFNSLLLSSIEFPQAYIEKMEVNAHMDELIVNYLREKEDTLLLSAKEKLNMAKQFNDRMREIYDSAIDEEKWHTFKNNLSQKIFKDRKGTDSHPLVDTSYFCSNMESGPLYINQLYSDINWSYLLKSQGTSVTSQLLKEIADLAQSKGFHTVLFYCPFYTNELDGVVIPELKTAIMDSEPPHEIEPLHPHDVIMKIGETCCRPEIIFSQTVELRELEAKYKQYMRQAMMHLQEYRKYKHQELNQLSLYRKNDSPSLLALLNGGFEVNKK